MFSYNKGFKSIDLFSSIENSQKEVQSDTLLENSSDQLFQADSNNSFEFENLRIFIKNHVSKIISIQEKINELNGIKLGKKLNVIYKLNF